MFSNDKKENERIENLASRIRIKTFACVNPGSFGPCTVHLSDSFEYLFKDDAWDIAALTSMHLYDMGKYAPQYNRYSFDVGSGMEVDFYVLRIEDLAVFCMENEIPEYVNEL